MSPEVTALLQDLFARLKAAEGPPRDPGVERWIKQAVAAQPAAPYLMAQALIHLQQELTAARSRIAQLESAAQEPRGGGLFSGLFGHHPPPPAPGRSGTPSGTTRSETPLYYPLPIGADDAPAAGDSGNGDFLADAAQTASGVAMGMMTAGAIGAFLAAGHFAPADDGDSDGDGVPDHDGGDSSDGDSGGGGGDSE